VVLLTHNTTNMKIPSLQKIRDAIRGNIMAENLAKQSNGNEGKLHNALQTVPESTMWRVVTWLHEIFLPKVAQLRGIDNDEYRNFVAARDAVIWSLHIAQQYEKILFQLEKDRQLLGYYVEQNAYLKREISKYQTAEELFTADAVKVYRDSIVSRAIELLNNQKK
jgi:hypothetical protein